MRASIERQREDARLLRCRVWEGFYTAAVNHRYYMRVAQAHPEQAAIGKRWRELQSEWRPLRWRDYPDAKQVELLEQRQDRIEESEDPSLYDDKAMSEAQEEFDRFIRAKK